MITGQHVRDAEAQFKANMLRARLETSFYGKTFYPDRFSLPFSSLHQKIFEVIDAVDAKGEPRFKKVVIKAPRGIGKTSIVKTLVSKRVRFNLCKHVVYIGKSHAFAAAQPATHQQGMITNR